MTITPYSTSKEHERDHYDPILRRVTTPTKFTFDAICTYVSKAFNIHPEDLKDLLPKRSLTLLDRKIFWTSYDLERDRRWEDHEFFFHQKMYKFKPYGNLPLQWEKAREDTENELEMLPQISIRELCSQLIEQLAQSNSTSYEQYMSKVDLISSKKMAAEQIYLTIPENIERRKQIDLKTWKESDDDAEAISILTAYWESFSHRENAICHYQLGENLLKKLFTGLKASIKEIRINSSPEGYRFNTPEIFDRDVYSSVNFFLDQFFQEFANLIQDPDKITSNYFHFKAKKLAASLAHRKIRKDLEEEYRFLKFHFAMDAENNKNRVIDKLKSSKNKLWRFQHYHKNYDREDVQEEIEYYRVEDKVLGTSKSKVFENRVSLEKKIAEHSAKIESLSQKLTTCTDDEFGMESHHIHPSKYPSILQKNCENASEWKILEIIKHMCNLRLLKSIPGIVEINDDSEHLGDSTSQFLEIIYEEDKQKLSLKRER